MNQQLVPFDFEGRPVRVVTDSQGEPWFVAADVCRVLEISKPENAYGASTTMKGIPALWVPLVALRTWW